MNLMPLLFDLAAQLDLIIQARAAADVDAEQAALKRADGLLVEYGRARMVRGEPAEVFRRAINRAAARSVAATPKAQAEKGAEA